MCARTMNYVLSVRREIVFFFYAFPRWNSIRKRLNVPFFLFENKRSTIMYVCVHLFLLYEITLSTFPARNRCQGYTDAVNVDKSTASRPIASGDKVQPLATRGTRNNRDKYRRGDPSISSTVLVANNSIRLANSSVFGKRQWPWKLDCVMLIYATEIEV